MEKFTPLAKILHCRRHLTAWTNSTSGVTYFALVNLAMSKVDVQDQGDQNEDGQGQVRIVMLYFNVLSQRLFK